MKIRKLQKSDLEALLSLYKQLHKHDEAPDLTIAQTTWERSEKSGTITYWGLFVNDSLVSTCQMVFVPNLTHGCKPYCVIENVVTHHEYRNLGYGKKILQHTLDEAWSLGCYKAMLMTGRHSHSVLSFYESVGFSGVEKHAFVATPGKK